MINRNKVIMAKKSKSKIGSLLKSISRNNMMLWIFLIVSNVIWAIVLMVTFSNQRVLAVDEAGRILGTFEYRNGLGRTDNEILRSSKLFIESYISGNSSTVYEDMALAFNMMSKDLRDRELESVKESHYIRKVKDADQRARIKWDDINSYVTYTQGNIRHVQVAGEVIIGLGKGKGRPFKITLEVGITPRTNLKTHGVEVLNYEYQ